MKKAIIGISILAIGIGTYFYLQDTKEKTTVENKVTKTDVIKKNIEKKQLEKMVRTKPIIIIDGSKKKGPEIVKGYLLPPEPDPKINNSTLLGVDSNNNMLRDDIERWVVKQPWSDKRIAASLQSMRGLQILIDDDIGDYNRRSTLSNMADYVLDVQRKYFDLGQQLDESREFRAKMFNTPERIAAYRKYDASFSGKLINGFSGSGKFSYKYADYTMEDGTLESYSFDSDRYLSDELIPLYSPENGLIGGYWSLETNKRVKFKGNWNDKFCEINFGIEKNGKDCWKAEDQYIQNLKDEDIVK